MGAFADLSGLKSRIIQIIQQHGGGTNNASQAAFTGGVSPSGSIDYLSSDEFNLCISKGYLQKWKPVGVQTDQQQAPGPSTNPN